MDIQKLLERFTEETLFLSNPGQGLETASGKLLLEVGEPIVTYVFENNINLNAHLMQLLCAISGENPVSPEHAGYVSEMAEDWKRWFRDKA